VRVSLKRKVVRIWFEMEMDGEKGGVDHVDEDVGAAAVFVGG
jgi:hypothetical protein